MDRLTRKELKTDKFAREVGHSVEYVSEHRQQFTRIAGIALAAVALAVAVYAFVQYRKGVRQDELRAALRIQEAAVGQPGGEGLLSYPTQDEKNKAMVKAFTDFVNKYDGTDEAAVAHYYLAATAADSGNLGEAEKQFRAVADSGNRNYASLAKLSLANIYQAQGKQAEGEICCAAWSINPRPSYRKNRRPLPWPAIWQARIQPKPARCWNRFVLSAGR